MKRVDVVKAQFGSQAAEYAKGCFVGDETLDVLLRMVEPRETDEVLDVATGAGFMAAALAPRVKEVIASDVTEQMLERADMLFRERGLSNAITDLVNAEDLPYADGVFDIVTCRIAAHHFESARRALKEMARVLKPGGRLGIADTASPSDKRIDAFLNEVEKLRDPAHVRNYSEEEWRSLLDDCGLIAESIAHGEFDLDFDDWIFRAGTSDKRKRQIRKMFLTAPPYIKESLKVREEGGKLKFLNFWIAIGAKKPVVDQMVSDALTDFSKNDV